MLLTAILRYSRTPKVERVPNRKGNRENGGKEIFGGEMGMTLGREASFEKRYVEPIIQIGQEAPTGCEEVIGGL